MAKLSDNMRRALEKLGREPDWTNAWRMRERLGTLKALRSRGLAESMADPGYLFDPSTGYKWRITSVGRAVLEVSHE